MPKIYTVTTNNPFAALDEHDDGDDLILNQSPEQISQMAAEKEQAAAAKDTRDGSAQKKRAPRAARNGDNSRVVRKTSPEAGEAVDAERRNRFRPSVRKPERPERLDRASGTGHGKEVKKQGAGAYSWGSLGEEGAAGGEVPAPPENDLSAWDNVPEGGAAPAPPAAEAKPEIQTFADYKAEQDKARGEGLEERQPTKSDKALGAGVRVYTKAVEEGATVKSAGAPLAGERAAMANTSSPNVNIRYNAPRPPRDGNDRRGGDRDGNDRRGGDRDGNDRRGGERDGNDRRGERSGSNGKREERKKSGSELKLDDAKAFPTLAH